MVRDVPAAISNIRYIKLHYITMHCGYTWTCGRSVGGEGFAEMRWRGGMVVICRVSQATIKALLNLIVFGIVRLNVLSPRVT